MYKEGYLSLNLPLLELQKVLWFGVLNPHCSNIGTTRPIPTNRAPGEMLSTISFGIHFSFFDNIMYFTFKLNMLMSIQLAGIVRAASQEKVLVGSGIICIKSTCVLR